MSTPAEVWRYQGGGIISSDYIMGASAAADNSVFLAGSSWGEWNATSAGGYDFSAAKLDENGSLLWAWQEGSEQDDVMYASAAMDDGGMLVAGYFNGTWHGETSHGDLDFAAAKLSSAGTVIWRWQDGTTYADVLRACVQTTDSNVVVAGYSQGSMTDIENDGYNDIVAVKLDVDIGYTIWVYQVGTEGSGGIYAKAAAARGDGSVVLAGKSYGTFNTNLTTTDGNGDFAAVAIDENGQELWRWQDGPDAGDNEIYSCTVLEDGSVILAGGTDGNWSGTSKGGWDFAMVKLNESGMEQWRWQGGTAFDDWWEGVDTAIDGSIVMAGTTYGNLNGNEGISADGVSDFVAMGMDAEGQQLWSYQGGTDDSDGFGAVAVRPDGSILLAGWTDGTWTTSEHQEGWWAYAAVLVDGSILSTPSPEATNVEMPSSTSVPSTARVEPLNTSSSSSTTLGVILGSVAAAAAVLVVLGVLVINANRRSRRDREAAGKSRSYPGKLRNYPTGAPPVHGAVPPPPPYGERYGAPVVGL